MLAMSIGLMGKYHFKSGRIADLNGPWPKSQKSIVLELDSCQEERDDERE
jgi:hypothetical protein